MSFQAVSDKEAAESPEDYIMHYNLNGIRMNEAAFQRLKARDRWNLPRSNFLNCGEAKGFRLFTGLVPWATISSARLWCGPAASRILIPTTLT